MKSVRALTVLSIATLFIFTALGTVLENDPGWRPVLAPVARGQAGCPGERVLDDQHAGAQSPDVLELQERLWDLGAYRGPLHGTFDAATRDAVRQWKQAHGLPADSRVDTATWEALAAGFTPVAAAQAPPGRSAKPPAGEPHIVIDAGQRTLTLYFGSTPYRRWPVATGKPGTPTPAGDWKIIRKDMNWGDGFGTRWLGLNVPWGIYGIHGTNKPYSIGDSVSGGCVRMFNDHVEELYDLVPMGTRVTVVGRPTRWEMPRRMRPGSSGPQVLLLQTELERHGLEIGARDGYYGPATTAAVRELQAYLGLPADGVATTDLLIYLGLR